MVYMSHMLRALRHRNYRLFYSGQGISLIGTWVQRLAMSWLVYSLTGSALVLGTIEFTSQFPALLITLFAGVLADRWDRRRILLGTQALSMIQALILAYLVLTNTVTIWLLAVLSAFLGFINAIDIPVRQSAVLDMVEDREDLGNAIALNSTMFNGARFIGPTLAGFMVSAFGVGICFLINGISYLAVIAALLLMKLTPRYQVKSETRIIHSLREGISFVRGFLPIKAIVLLLGFCSFMGMPYTLMMPIFASEVLKGGPRTLGFLMAGAGLGALMGAIYLASRQTVLGLEKVIPLAAGLFGLGLLFLSVVKVLWLAVAVLVLTGFGMMVMMASSNTILQTICDDDKRGRVMSFYTIALMGMHPLGSLLIGFMASRWGVTVTLIFSGTACMAGALAFALKLPQIREIAHPRMGIGC